MTETTLHAYRAAVFTFLDDPDTAGADAYHYWEDGLLVTANGRIHSVGAATDLLATLPPDTPVTDYRGKLLLPGLIDTHIHYPQVEVMGAYGEQLLDWLNIYTFPAEQQFSDASYARTVAEFFVDELLRNGTTTALVFATVHAQAVDAFFQASSARNTRMICGKVMMDRHAPETLTDTADSSYADSAQLIERWHGQGRQLYAVTPRFAITSTSEQLAKAGELCRRYPGTYLQTHLSENQDEVAFVRELFPERIDYLDVYDHYGLLHAHSVFAHGIHLTEREHQRLQETGASIAFCPTSNLFLGSGLLNVRQLLDRGVPLSVATDVGGGTSFSLFRTLGEAYKVCQLQGQPLSPLKSLYLATLGNARTLQLADRIGSLQPGNEADFIVVDPKATPLLDFRMRSCRTLEEQLFALITLADDRVIHATYIAGDCRYTHAGGPTP